MGRYAQMLASESSSALEVFSVMYHTTAKLAA